MSQSLGKRVGEAFRKLKSQGDMAGSNEGAGQQHSLKKGLLQRLGVKRNRSTAHPDVQTAVIAGTNTRQGGEHTLGLVQGGTPSSMILPPVASPIGVPIQQLPPGSNTEPQSEVTASIDVVGTIEDAVTDFGAPQNGWRCCQCKQTNLNDLAAEKCSSCGHQKCNTCET